MPHAHAAGLRVLAYVNLHWFSNVFADAHPGWEQLLADGRAYGRVNPLYGNGTTLCVNSAWRDWAYLVVVGDHAHRRGRRLPRRARRVPGRLPLPRLPLALPERTGEEPPTADEAEPRALRRWQDFREWSMERFVDGRAGRPSRPSTRTASCSPTREVGAQHRGGAAPLAARGAPAHHGRRGVRALRLAPRGRARHRGDGQVPLGRAQPRGRVQRPLPWAAGTTWA